MKVFFIIFISFLVAALLQMVPLPIWAIWLRPEWILLVLIYWILYLPENVGLNTAFVAGVFLDVLMGTLLGENAFAFVAIVYIMMRFSRRIELSPGWQQAVLILFLMLIFQTYKFMVWRWLYGQGVEPLYWISSATTALLWPWVYAILSKLQHHHLHPGRHSPLGNL
ncbi:MAG: mreD [Gammaproteobacteria bacterium]|jgi:rod shape-determining protein MreD|nr:mreD [Gammaproteobacteria bacterium]